MIPILPVLAAAKAMIPWRPLAVAAVAALVAYALFFWGHTSGAESVQARWDTEKAAVAAQRAADMARALETQQALQSQIDKTRRQGREEVARINRLHAAALDSLRQRPERPAASGDDPPPGAGAIARSCTGADLYREDATVLVGIARDADILRAALIESRARYQAAKDQLDALAAGGR